ncbi:MAG: NAD-dependent epimerase/dehydratase family protein [Rhizobiaceae bacterium]|nr:NAD-dependent epimerase/dehydratase family protein [Rhizobiaceae bacterium]
MKKVVLVAGATGLVGDAAMRHFSQSGDAEVLAVSRRAPRALYGARHLRLDLRDRDACAELLGKESGVTHVIYAALWEKESLVEGWSSDLQIEVNDQMLRNLIDPLIDNAALQQIVLLQGGKAYGSHKGHVDIPARENRSELRSEPNFYWRQEDYLRSRQIEGDWSWTILRPQLIVGKAIGGSMNVIAALGVYASLLRMRSEPLHYPGGECGIGGIIDADIIAAAADWAGRSECARNEIFNINNGDVFQWNSIWPSIAASFNMEVGEIKPMSLHESSVDWSGQWDELRRKHKLSAPSMNELVGSSFQYLDYAMSMRIHNIMSTVKLRSAGFARFADSEQTLRKWFHEYMAEGLLPPV